MGLYEVRRVQGCGFGPRKAAHDLSVQFVINILAGMCYGVAGKYAQTPGLNLDPPSEVSVSQVMI